MDTQDLGDFRSSAARELVEEVVLCRETDRTAGELAPLFDNWAGLSVSAGEGLLSQIANSRECVSLHPCKKGLKTYFVCVSRLATPPRGWELTSLGWRDPAMILQEPRVHWGLRNAIRFFARELESLPPASA